MTIQQFDDALGLIHWNNALIRPTLQVAKAQLGLSPGIGLRNLVLAKLPNASRLKVHHLIALDESYLNKTWL